MSGPTDFAPISIDKAVEEHVRLNGGSPSRARVECRRHIRLKKAGRRCMSCETLPIWAFGRSGMCFSCTTGEADASNDFEFEEVCF